VFVTPTAKPPIWRNVRFLAWAFQLVALALVVTLIAILANNVRVNSANLGVPVGLDFLEQPASFEIPANEFRSTQSVQSAMVQGALNTLRVAILGIVLATILGVLVGIGRLSGNWLVRNLSRIFVESIRNIPLLGIVVFAYLALVLSALPSVQESWELSGLVIANTRGTSVPWFTGAIVNVLASAALAGLVAWLIRRWRLSRLDQYGEAPNVFWWTAPVFVLVMFWTAFLLGIGVTTPMVDGRRVVGGITLQPEYFALLIALVIYTASHIAEIVRGSIQAVPRGQAEASMAMALSPVQRMRFVILPQATRIALPPLGNQYLNLLKNSSLGFVISYFELTKVTSTTIGNRSPAVPAYLLMMLLYLIASLSISAVVNFFNRRLRIH
jgi:general L-amino acid transport system permease protein